MTHWKKLTDPDYLGAYELLTTGKDLTVTIKYVNNEKVTSTDGKKEDCMVAHFVENVKPMVLNSTNAKTIQKLYNTPFVEEWQGKKITLYVTQVKAFGDMVDALRIRPTIPKSNDTNKYICADCGNEVKAVEINGKTYSASSVAQSAQNAFKEVLCYDCFTRRKSVQTDEG